MTCNSRFEGKFCFGFSHFASCLAIASLFLVGTLSQTGCHRGFYRRQADAEAQRLIQQKQNDPRWSCTSDGTILVNPQSRMFDPFSQDHPPMPPDDPTSNELMQCVDGHPGYPLWNANGNTDFVENPDWKSYLAVDEKGAAVLDQSTAYRLALVNSTQLQRGRESLYLSALDVSLERFGFDSQLFANFGTAYRALTRGNGQSLTPETRRGFSKLGTAGAQYLLSFANQFVWTFGGGGTSNNASSLINFSIVQPLLRGAGRDVIMNSLTQAERTLLANVRQFDRYRRGFYLEITTGRSATRSVAGVGISAAPNFGRNASGYLGLLQAQQQIAINEFEVSQNEDVLEQFREFFKRERIDGVQVSNFESTVYRSQRRLLQAKTNYQTQVDRFKMSLGLPPTVDVVVQDDYLDRFKFISDGITGRQTSINDLRVNTGELLNQLDDSLPKTKGAVANFIWPDDISQKVSVMLPFILSAQKTLEQLRTTDSQELQDDFSRLAAVRPERVAYLAKLKQSIDAGEFDVRIDPAILQPESIQTPEALRALFVKVEKNASDAEQKLNQLVDTVQTFDQLRIGKTNDELYDLIDNQIIKQTSSLFSAIYDVALEMSLLQAEARSNSIGLPEVNLSSEDAIKIARCFRRDWMNNRAALVDQWREIEVVADRLESDFDLTLDAGIGTHDKNLLDYRFADSTANVGFQFDTPLNRQAEGVAYRASLIRYQQAKRDYYKYEDEVEANLRAILRELELNKVLFELNRQGILTAIQALEQARFALIDPRQQQLSGNVQQNLTNAITGLQNAQNSFLGGWVDFEVLRRNLDFDLGTFQLGPDCTWIDPVVIDSQIGFRAAAMMGIDLQKECYCDLDGLGGIPNLEEQQPQETPANETAPGVEASKLQSQQTLEGHNPPVIQYKSINQRQTRKQIDSANKPVIIVPSSQSLPAAELEQPLRSNSPSPPLFVSPDVMESDEVRTNLSDRSNANGDSGTP
ncbi:MAG: TolC family protein [Mariniblastus sp.]|nr:TolC family protein [Mariniblastus sp.]